MGFYLVEKAKFIWTCFLTDLLTVWKFQVSLHHFIVKIVWQVINYNLMNLWKQLWSYAFNLFMLIRFCKVLSTSTWKAEKKFSECIYKRERTFKGIIIPYFVIKYLPRFWGFKWIHFIFSLSFFSFRDGSKVIRYAKLR